MRRDLLLACLVFIVATSVVAAPWSRLRRNTAPREQSPAWNWTDEREIGPYLFRSEFPLNDVHELVQDLGDLQDDLEHALNLKCEPTAIQIHLFGSKRTYDQFLKIREPEGMKRKALYIPGADGGQIYAYRQNDLDTDVRHETTHALLHTALPYVPLWIDEGFAEYFEVPARLRAKGNSHRKELQDAIRFYRWKPNIEHLEAKRKMLEMNGKDYRDSWGIVHFILLGPPAAREALSIYFDEIQSGAAPTPLSQHLRERIPNLEQAIVDHLMK